MPTIQEIRNQFGVYNKTINNFIKAFDIHIYDRYYLEKPNYFGDFRDYQPVSEEFAKILYSFKDIIIEFEKDYYRWKTPEDISNTTGLRIELIISQLNKTIYSFMTKELDEDGKWRIIDVYYLKDKVLTDSTPLKKISSYIIMRDIQIENRKEKIKIALNNNC